MIDIETIGVAPGATILTIAAQAFDPLGTGYYNQQYYARITLESQENRTIDDSTLNWWATQPAAARDEAVTGQGGGGGRARLFFQARAGHDRGRARARPPPAPWPAAKPEEC